MSSHTPARAQIEPDAEHHADRRIKRGAGSVPDRPSFDVFIFRNTSSDSLAAASRSSGETCIAAEGLSGPCGIRLGSTDEGEIGMIYFISTLRIEGTTLPEEFNPPLDFG
jgi:hypothetical protein